MLIRKLRSIFSLSEDEQTALAQLPVQISDVPNGHDIVREGDRPSRSSILMEGFACSYKMTGDGRRQIMAFYIPGDMPDLLSLHLKTLDHSIGTITACKLGFVQHEALEKVCDDFPRIGKALWRETLVNAAIFREWMTGIGRRSAYSRIAHLLCELVVKQRAVGLAQDHTCDLPITQAEFGDALGLSTVHVNRTLQDLRGDALIRLKGQSLTVLDWEGLKRAGDFDPVYLHLENEQVAA